MWDTAAMQCKVKAYYLGKNEQLNVYREMMILNPADEMQPHLFLDHLEAQRNLKIHKNVF